MHVPPPDIMPFTLPMRGKVISLKNYILRARSPTTDIMPFTLPLRRKVISLKNYILRASSPTRHNAVHFTTETESHLIKKLHPACKFPTRHNAVHFTAEAESHLVKTTSCVHAPPPDIMPFTLPLRWEVISLKNYILRARSPTRHNVVHFTTETERHLIKKLHPACKFPHKT